jgi:Holliday junction DNA helicase RuvA
MRGTLAMIGRLSGALVEKRPPWLLVDVGGVGYEVEVPMTTFYHLPEVGGAVQLHTHLLVREDAHQLYGFATQGERALFRDLLRITGVGARLALTVLSGMEPAEFAASVRAGDVARLTRLPGVGRKTAERLIVELRDRLDAHLGHGGDAAAGGGPLGAAASPADPVEEAVAALISLGYKPPEASRYVQAVVAEGRSSEDLIRLALKALIR